MTIPFALFSTTAHEAEKILAPAHFHLASCASDMSGVVHTAKYVHGDRVLLFQCNNEKAWLRIIEGKESTFPTQTEELFFRGSLRSCEEHHITKTLHDALSFLQRFITPHAHDEEDDHCMCGHHHA